MKPNGFTLIELLVSFTIFSLVFGAGMNLLFSGIAHQRRGLAVQELLTQTSFFTEHANRALRQARREEGSGCLSARGLNYEITRGSNGIKFLNQEYQCQEFFLQEGRIVEGINGREAYLTSNDMEITAFRVALVGQSGDDDLQPRVTFALAAKVEGAKPEERADIQLQTTVSQRQYDVRR